MSEPCRRQPFGVLQPVVLCGDNEVRTYSDRVATTQAILKDQIAEFT
ncbi:hypothetical protein RHIZ404_220111 [Rhizobium sp. EC-SD404]|nr:hypothetical protein RHIZ404_220111 [Rhizobium sp. EC-SD404]